MNKKPRTYKIVTQYVRTFKDLFFLYRMGSNELMGVSVGGTCLILLLLVKINYWLLLYANYW